MRRTGIIAGVIVVTAVGLIIYNGIWWKSLWVVGIMVYVASQAANGAFGAWIMGQLIDEEKRAHAELMANSDKRLSEMAAASTERTDKLAAEYAQIHADFKARIFRLQPGLRAAVRDENRKYCTATKAAPCLSCDLVGLVESGDGTVSDCKICAGKGYILGASKNP